MMQTQPVMMQTQPVIRQVHPTTVVMAGQPSGVMVRTEMPRQVEVSQAIVPAGANEMTLARPGDVTINVIHACGRTLTFPNNVELLSDITRFLQTELGMQDQIFEVSDLYGRRLILDSDVQEALAEGRMPFSASLCDSSIHFIENRREELAQMQWKLVRDQHNQAQLKLSQFNRQMGSVESDMDTLKREIHLGFERLRTEMQTAIEGTREQLRAEARQMGERVTGVGQLVNAERNMREVSLQQFNKTLQGVRDTIDNDRASNQDKINLTLSQISETRKLIDEQRSRQDAGDDKLQMRMREMTERMDELATQMKGLVEENKRHFAQASLGTTEALESHSKVANRVRADTEHLSTETNSRLALMEERFSTIEQRMLEAQERQNESFERLQQRADKHAFSVEQVKFDTTQHGDGLQNFNSKMKQFADIVNQQEAHMKEVQDRERAQRDNEMRTLREHMISEHNRLLQSQENRLASKIEHEAVQRQDNVNQVLENVNDMLKREGHNSVDARKRLVVQAQPTVMMAPPMTTVQSIRAPTVSAMPTTAIMSRPGMISPTALTSVSIQPGMMSPATSVQPGMMSPATSVRPAMMSPATSTRIHSATVPMTR